jgi:5-carboxymethyl-2-hydroxymuconate isomerase
MPHFIIDCSENIILQKNPAELMQIVYATAEATGLFARNDIKVRLNPYKYYKLGEAKTDFIHIFAHIMQGRSVEQRADLSRKIIERLKLEFPEIAILSMNVSEFEKATYSNKALVDPQNTANDQHFNS